MQQIMLSESNTFFMCNSELDVFKKFLKENLVEICWGVENVELFSYEQVITELELRITKKTPDQQLGLIGELIYFYYLLTKNNEFKPISLFFNQESRNVKLGFDGTILQNDKVWYSEVKSGSTLELDLDSFNSKKMSEAYSDLKKKFYSENRNSNLWSIVKANLVKIIQSPNERKNIAKILDYDIDKKIENVIIVTTIFNNSNTELSKCKIDESLIRYKSTFSNCTIVSFRKKTVDSILDIIKELKHDV